MIAVSVPSLMSVSVRESLETVSTHFGAWEVVGEGGHFLPDIESELAELAPSYGVELSVHAPYSDVNLASLSPRMRQCALSEVVSTIYSAGRLGMHSVTVHPGAWSPMGMRDRQGVLRSVRASMDAIDSAAEDAGVMVCIENMPSWTFLIGREVDELMRLIEGTSLSVCLDVGHANTMGKLSSFVRIADRIAHMHVHDNDGSKDAHLPIGDGTVDMDEVARTLPSYDGWYVIESRNYRDAVIALERLKVLV